MGMPVFGRSRVPLLPTNRRPTLHCLSGILFEQIVSNPWVSPSNEPCRKSRPRSIRPSRADSQNNRHDPQVASTSPVENRDAEERPDMESPDPRSAVTSETTIVSPLWKRMRKLKYATPPFT